MSVDTVETETIVRDAHLHFEGVLLSGIHRVAQAQVTDYDGGICSIISLLSVLPAKHRVQFKIERARFTEIVKSDTFNERGTNRITRRVRNQYMIAVADCLSLVIDVLDDAGLLFKSKTELIGRE